MENQVTNVNQKVMGALGSVNWMTIGGWIVFALIAIGGGFFLYSYYKNKKIFNKKINVHSIMGSYWKKTYTDLARAVKIGKGGFEILYLKKLKTWKIAYGGNLGDNNYDFYVLPDGYWYNGMMSADVNAIDKAGGLIPIVTTNPLMRGQYTALEKQIDSLHGDKIKWWDKYGNYVLSMAFVLIAGTFLWLMFKEFSTAMAQLTTYHNSMAELLDKVNILMSNSPTTNTGGLGLIPVS